MKLKHTGKVAVGVAVIAVALTGCGAGGDGADGSSNDDPVAGAEALGGEEIAAQLDELYAAAQEAGETSVIAYGPGEQLYGAAYQTFMQRYPDISVTGEYIFGAELSTRLEQEAASGQNVGSILTAGPPAVNAANGAGQCSAYEPFTAEYLDSDLISEGGTYRALVGYPFGIGYNTDLISEADLPQTYTDLSDPAFSGQFVLNDPTTVNGTTNTMAAMWADGLIDEAWVADVGAQDSLFRTNAALATQAVATGEAAFDPFTQYVTFKQSIDDGLPVDFYFPLENARIEYHYSCVLEGAPNSNATELFYNWLFTPEGQEALSTTGVYGIRPDTPSPEGLPSFEEATADLMASPAVAEAGATTQQFLEVARQYFQP
ncbi:extracellular solute-binding protein [Microbacterium sp. NPDC077184]|uniref:ABC transporter substrate-binding protein n=1 Tax=Microbacterium sp. NPDC077184 TaxID=3154764 RepID=UPI003436A014